MASTNIVNTRFSDLKNFFGCGGNGNNGGGNGGNNSFNNGDTFLAYASTQNSSCLKAVLEVDSPQINPKTSQILVVLTDICIDDPSSTPFVTIMGADGKPVATLTYNLAWSNITAGVNGISAIFAITCGDVSAMAAFPPVALSGGGDSGASYTFGGGIKEDNGLVSLNLPVNGVLRADPAKGLVAAISSDPFNTIKQGSDYGLYSPAYATVYGALAYNSSEQVFHISLSANYSDSWNSAYIALPDIPLNTASIGTGIVLNYADQPSVNVPLKTFYNNGKLTGNIMNCLNLTTQWLKLEKDYKGAISLYAYTVPASAAGGSSNFQTYSIMQASDRAFSVAKVTFSPYTNNNPSNLQLVGVSLTNNSGEPVKWAATPLKPNGTDSNNQLSLYSPNTGLMQPGQTMNFPQAMLGGSGSLGIVKLWLNQAYAEAYWDGSSLQAIAFNQQNNTGNGGSVEYTFSAPLKNSGGTVSLNIDASSPLELSNFLLSFNPDKLESWLSGHNYALKTDIPDTKAITAAVSANTLAIQSLPQPDGTTIITKDGKLSASYAISKKAGNAASEETDGLYVPETDLAGYAKTADIPAADGTTITETAGKLSANLTGYAKETDIPQADSVSVSEAGGKLSVKLSAHENNSVSIETDGVYSPKLIAASPLEISAGNNSLSLAISGKKENILGLDTDSMALQAVIPNTYALKTDIPNVSSFETKESAAEAYQPKGNYAVSADLPKSVSGDFSEDGISAKGTVITNSSASSFLIGMQKMNSPVLGALREIKAGETVDVSEVLMGGNGTITIYASAFMVSMFCYNGKLQGVYTPMQA